MDAAKRTHIQEGRPLDSIAAPLAVVVVVTGVPLVLVELDMGGGRCTWMRSEPVSSRESDRYSSSWVAFLVPIEDFAGTPNPDEGSKILASANAHINDKEIVNATVAMTGLLLIIC